MQKTKKIIFAIKMLIKKKCELQGRKHGTNYRLYYTSGILLMFSSRIPYILLLDYLV